jgi:hypothetical protein
MSSHCSMDPRLLQGLYFGSSQGLDKLTIVYELICRIRILCVRVIEGLPEDKYSLPSSSTAGGGITLIVLLTTSYVSPYGWFTSASDGKEPNFPRFTVLFCGQSFNEWDNSERDVRISL